MPHGAGVGARARDRPFTGKSAPAWCSTIRPTARAATRSGSWRTYILQVDAYSGYNALYVEGRQPGPIIEAACWAHGRHKMFELARLRKMPNRARHQRSATGRAAQCPARTIEAAFRRAGTLAQERAAQAVLEEPAAQGHRLQPEALRRLADVLARIADDPASRIDELLPWQWKAAHQQQMHAA